MAEQVAQAAETSGLAIAALILSILSFVGLGPLGSIPGIICGHMAKAEIRRNPNVGGDGLATAGLIIGYLGLALMLIFIGLFLLVFVFLAASHASTFHYVH